MTDTQNEKMFEMLADSALLKKAEDEVRKFTAQRIPVGEPDHGGFTRFRLPFTRMPKDGFFRLICPPVNIYPIADLQKWGWPHKEAWLPDRDGVPMGQHIYERGQRFYYVLEDVLEEAWNRRLIAERRMTRSQWKRWNGRRRCQAKIDAGVPIPDRQRGMFELTKTREAYRAGFFEIMGRLRSQVAEQACLALVEGRE